jgi:hypothetical protein
MSDRIFTGLDVDVGDRLRPLLDEQARDLISLGALADE